METPRVGNEPSGLPSGTGTNSSISSLDPTVVDILRNNFGFKLKSQNLSGHSAEASGPQESEFQSFIDKAKIHEIGLLDKCVILVKTIISGNYGLEVAKQVLGKLIQIGKDSEPSGNLGFLKAAFGAIALPENEADVAHNMKHLLRLSKGKIPTIDIINEFKNIGDVDRRIEFLCKLQENLSGEEKTEFEEFLAGALDGVADQIAAEFEKDQNKDKAALLAKLKSIDSLRTALLAAKSKIPTHLLSQGPSGLAVVKAFIGRGELDPTKFSPDEAKEFVNALLANSLSGIDYVLELINDGSGSKLPKLKSPDEVRTRASQFKKLHSTFEHGITKAFFGKTHNAGDKSLEAIWLQLRKLTLRLRLWALPLKGACEIWQTIANEVAASCFGTNGKVDSEKLKGLMAFLGNEEIFKKPPYCFIPHTELMRSQMYTVCESLLNSKNPALDLLNATNEITVGQHGQAILKAMSNGRTQSLTPPIAILSSLFTPHRQRALPTCTIDSLINAEIRNHPEQLIKMYRQMLVGDQFTLPSGHAIRQQKIEGGFITVDLTNGGEGREDIFEDINSYNPYKILTRKMGFAITGVKYPISSNPEDKYKLSLSVHNMNDILFANFFQASNFGNKYINGNGNYGTMLLYTGHKRYSKMYLPEIDVGGSNFLDVMEELKRHAKEQQRLGNHYMRVQTNARKFTIFGGNDHFCHAENIDIDAILSLDLNNMKIGKAYPISDRNWSGSNTSGDIPRLAIRKMGDIPPTYEFGTLWDGSQFEKINLKSFSIYDNHTYYIFNKGHNHWN
jgi:hypothetical protein